MAQFALSLPGPSQAYCLLAIFFLELHSYTVSVFLPVPFPAQSPIVYELLCMLADQRALSLRLALALLSSEAGSFSAALPKVRRMEYLAAWGLATEFRPEAALKFSCCVEILCVISFLLSHIHAPALTARRCVSGEDLQLPSVPKRRYVDSLNGSCSLKYLDVRVELSCRRSDERMFSNDFSYRKCHFLLDRKEQEIFLPQLLSY